MVPERKYEVPEDWTIDVQEVAPYQFRAVAVATDGRRIEMAGTDETRLSSEVLASIEEFETQAKYRKIGMEREA